MSGSLNFSKRATSSDPKVQQWRHLRQHEAPPRSRQQCTAVSKTHAAVPSTSASQKVLCHTADRSHDQPPAADSLLAGEGRQPSRTSNPSISITSKHSSEADTCAAKGPAKKRALVLTSKHSSATDAGAEEGPAKKRTLIWNKEELQLLIAGVRELGYKWNAILSRGGFHPGRTSTSLKNKWQSICRAVCNNSKQRSSNPMTSDMRLEVTLLIDLHGEYGLGNVLQKQEHMAAQHHGMTAVQMQHAKDLLVAEVGAENCDLLRARIPTVLTWGDGRPDAAIRNMLAELHMTLEDLLMFASGNSGKSWPTNIDVVPRIATLCKVLDVDVQGLSAWVAKSPSLRPAFARSSCEILGRMSEMQQVLGKPADFVHRMCRSDPKALTSPPVDTIRVRYRKILEAAKQGGESYQKEVHSWSPAVLTNVLLYSTDHIERRLPFVAAGILPISRRLSYLITRKKKPWESPQLSHHQLSLKC